MSALETRLAGYAPHLRGIMRIMIGLLFLEHGTGKLFGFPFIKMFETLSPLSLPGIAGMFELVGGALIALGLFTRPVAFILAGEMAIAYFLAHAPNSFFPVLNGGELAIVYCFIFLYLAAAGGGAWSLDQQRGVA
jgi:putative oxidoreductase